MSGDVRAEIRELRAQVDGIEAKHRIGLLMAQNKRLRWALETVAFVRHKCPGCRKIAERILAGATIEAALDGAHVPDEEVLR